MTPSPGSELTLDQQVPVMQIIKFGLIMGVAGFAGYIIFIAPRPALPNELDLVWLLAAFGGIQLLARLFVPSFVVRWGLRRIATGNWFSWPTANPNISAPTTDEGRLAGLYHTQMLVGSALLEGGAFANLYSCMTTGHIVSWIMSGVLLLGLVIDFPTRLSVERWIESKMAWIKDERSLAGRPGS